MAADNTSAKSFNSYGSSKGSMFPHYSTKSSLRKKETLKNRLLEAKIREEYQKRKNKERLYRRKLIGKQKRVQNELEYLNFPTLAGFYFDGFHVRHFLLRKEWADIFNELEEVNARKKERDHNETFPEAVKRNFWPPRILGGFAFRTRGIYLDCKEVMRDPPRTPPEINKHDDKNFEDNENGHAADYSGLVWGGDGGGPEAVGEGESEQGGAGAEGGRPGRAGIFPKQGGGGGAGDGFGGQEFRNKRFGVVGGREDEINKHDFYFDEDLAKFLPRKTADPESIYFDTKFSIWRLKRATLKYNGDWYFDFDKGVFVLKDRSKCAIYQYDNLWNVWKLRGNNGPSKNGLLPKDYYYNELHNVWDEKKGSKAPFDENGWRFAKRIPITGPDDFYFDESDYGVFQLKQRGQGKSYNYDVFFGAWRKIGAENSQSKLKPSNYYWSDSECVYKIKDGPREWYELDTNNKFQRKKKLLQGKHHPANWKWNINTRRWQKKKSNRSNIFTQVLNWRPERNYEKPWLDYYGYEYNFVRTELGPGTGSGQGQGQPGATGQFDKNTAGGRSGKVAVPTKEAVYGERLIDQALYKAAQAEWGDEDYKNNPNRIPFDSPARDIIDFTSTKQVTKMVTRIDPESGKAEPIVVIDKSIDRKRLRCGNLGGIITEKELKAFFFAATEVVRPKDQDPEDHDDYLYIQFESDEAAMAAFKTMDRVDIKGQKITLVYPRRHQK